MGTEGDGDTPIVNFELTPPIIKILRSAIAEYLVFLNPVLPKTSVQGFLTDIYNNLDYNLNC